MPPGIDAAASPALLMRNVSKRFGPQVALDGSDRGRFLRPIRRRQERAEARQALAALGYDIAPTAPIASLAEAERTAVAIARALHDFDDGPVLVLDEPTASLPGPEVRTLF